MKLSRYNYFTENKEKDLLLFNTLQGTSSFLKIPKEKKEAVTAVLRSSKPILELQEDEIYTALVKHGYILPDTADEEAKLRSIYLEKVADPGLHLTLIPTEQCNFRCKYCYESFPNNVMSRETQNAVLLFLKKNMNKYASLQVSWFGGEPLLGLEAIESMSQEMKKICAFHRKPFTASITTNGFLLEPEVFKRLLHCNVLYYQITIDGTKDIHDMQRPHEKLPVSTYDAVVGNLQRIKREVKNSTFRITIRSNFSKLHMDRIEEYKETFYQMFGDDKRFLFFVRPVMDWGGDSIDAFKDNLVDESGLDTFYEKLMATDCKLNYIYDGFLDNAGGVCEAGQKNSFVITTDGSIYKCTCNFEDCPQAKIGQLEANGCMNLEKEAQNQWLCSFSHCTKDCFYAPICLRDACSAVRVLKRDTKEKCPLEKRNLSKILQLLDA